MLSNTAKLTPQNIQYRSKIRQAASLKIRNDKSKNAVNATRTDSDHSIISSSEDLQDGGLKGTLQDREQDKKGLFDAFTGGGISGIEPSPHVLWGKEITIEELEDLRVSSKPGADQLPTIFPSEGVFGLVDEERDLISRRDELLAELRRSGAIHFSDFNLMKNPEGFHKFYDALNLEPCLDPIHSVAARPVSSKEHKIYEAVNKPSRSNYIVGMHNEMVGTQAPQYAGFVCFKPAEEGGEFWVVGGNDLFHELDLSLLTEMQKRKVIFSVFELPFGWLDDLDLAPFGPIQWKEESKKVARYAFKALVKIVVDFKVDFDVFFRWVEKGYDGNLALQGYANPQPGVIRDPISDIPVVFCNIHSHSKFLRSERQKVTGELQKTTGASKANKTDVSYGNNMMFTDEELKEVDRATMKVLKKVHMKKGDVILLDNYRTMHGRGVFKGSRHNAVAWFSRITT
ncbi:MAG: hypothetical protein CL430_06520 [Acidimicrobiaceae bacterium]|nr:hypothetical protein [Acidimicrobiaceae bacterium]